MKGQRASIHRLRWFSYPVYSPLEPKAPPIRLRLFFDFAGTRQLTVRVPNIGTHKVALKEAELLNIRDPDAPLRPPPLTLALPCRN